MKKKTVKKAPIAFLEALETFAGEALKERGQGVFAGKETAYYVFSGEAEKADLTRRIFAKDPSQFVSYEWIEKNKGLFVSSKEGEEEILSITPEGREKVLMGLTPAALLQTLDSNIKQKLLGHVRVISAQKEKVKEFIEI